MQNRADVCSKVPNRKGPVCRETPGNLSHGDSSWRRPAQVVALQLWGHRGERGSSGLATPGTPGRVSVASGSVTWAFAHLCAARFRGFVRHVNFSLTTHLNTQVSLSVPPNYPF